MHRINWFLGITIIIVIGLLVGLACSSAKVATPSPTKSSATTSRPATTTTTTTASLSPAPSPVTTPTTTTKLKLPSMFVWAGLVSGTTGNSQALGFGEAVSKKTGVPVKVVPTSTEMSAWMPLRSNEFQFVYKASTSTYNLIYALGDGVSAQDWGPQDVRLVWATDSIVGFGTTKDTGIKTYADLKGKRLPEYKGYDIGVMNVNAVLAASGLTRNDVKWVPVQGVMGGQQALMDGQIDMALISPEGSFTIEMNAKKGVVYLEAPKDKDSLNKWFSQSPFFTPGWLVRGVAVDKPVWWCVINNFLVAYGTSDTDSAYATTKAIYEGYDIYKGMHSSLAYATADIPLNYKKFLLPYHDGTVRYLKEIGKWTPDMDRWQKDQVDLAAKRKAAFQVAIKAYLSSNTQASADKLGSDPAWNSPIDGFWIKWLKDNSLLKPAEITYQEYQSK